MKLISTLILFFTIVSSTYSQDTTKIITQYVFPEFSVGNVLMKSGVTKQIKLNYNSLTEEMILDNNGTLLALANPEYVDTVYIKGRKFIYYGKIFYEVPVNLKVPLLIKYITSLIPAGAPTAFGGTSETSTATVVNNLYQSGRAYEMKLPDDSRINNSIAFYIKMENDLVWVNSVRQVTRCFPAKSNEIKEFVKSSKTNFKKTEDMISLIKFCNKN
jgi:hypothetical protein